MDIIIHHSLFSFRAFDIRYAALVVTKWTETDIAKFASSSGNSRMVVYLVCFILSTKQYSYKSLYFSDVWYVTHLYIRNAVISHTQSSAACYITL